MYLILNRMRLHAAKLLVYTSVRCKHILMPPSLLWAALRFKQYWPAQGSTML